MKLHNEKQKPIIVINISSNLWQNKVNTSAQNSICSQSHILFSLSLTVITAIFPAKLRLASFIGAKVDGGGGVNWSYKTCKELQSNRHHQQTNTQLYRPDALPVAQPTVSEH